ncbi:MAG: hypothetical protein ACLR1V_07165 [Coprococcus sp.]
MLPALDNSDKACDAIEISWQKRNLGIKTGKGFFEYPEEKRGQIQMDFYRRLIVQLKASKNYD